MNDSSKIRVNLISVLMKCPSKDEIIVPLGAIFATKWPQQQKRKQERFEQPTTMRTPDIRASAEWATSKEIEATVWHAVRFEEGMLTRPLPRVKY
jgi:hypothetical protein